MASSDATKTSVSKSQVKKPAKKQIKRLAPDLSVADATAFGHVLSS